MSHRLLKFGLPLLLLVVVAGCWLVWSVGKPTVTLSDSVSAVEVAKLDPKKNDLARTAAVTGNAPSSSPTINATPDDQARGSDRDLGPDDPPMVGAVLLRSNRSGPDEQQRVTETRVWRTMFKYPLLRTDTVLREDVAGRNTVIQRETFVADHVMVQLGEAIVEADVRLWAQQNGFEVRHKLSTAPIYLIATTTPDKQVEDIMQAVKEAFPPPLGETALVVEKDFIVQPMRIPNDSSFTSLWGLHNTGQNGGLADADVDAPEAWDITTGSKDVLVGVIDTGISRTHPDLAANMWTNPNEIQGNGIDDDRNGFVDDVHGWDFYSNDPDPNDEDDHGTHVAGTIGATGNNGTGVTGVNWVTSMVAVRFLGPYGGTTSDAIESVNYASAIGCDITNNSWGGGGFSSLLLSAIQSAGAGGSLFVAAAGNSAYNTDLSPSYPASYNVENVISVASTTATDTLSSFSNYGLTSVDLGAPGSRIYSTVPGTAYATFDGTSMACPHVSGAMALMLSVAPNLSVADAKRLLLRTTDPISTLSGRCVSGGRLNVARLVTEAAGPVVSDFTFTELAGGNGDGIANPGERFSIAVKVINYSRDTLSSLNLTLSAPQMTIVTGTATITNLQSGAEAQADPFFVFELPANLSTPFKQDFTVTLTPPSPMVPVTATVPFEAYRTTSLAGLVTELGTNAPIAGARVYFSGPRAGEATTGADGRYSITAIDGTYAVSVKSSGYLDSQAIQVTMPPNQTNIDFSLVLSNFQVNPGSLQFAVAAGKTAKQDISLMNRGTAAIGWNSSIRYIDVPAPLTTLREHTLTSSKSPDGNVQDSADQAHSTRQTVVHALDAPLSSLTGRTVGYMLSNSAYHGVIDADLIQRGAKITLLASPFTAQALDELDAIILGDEVEELSVQDLTLLEGWIADGGGLLLMADNAENIGVINRLLAGSGLTAFARPGGFQNLTLTNIRPHSITTQISSIFQSSTGAGATQAAGSRAMPLVLQDDGGIHAALASRGMGWIIFVGNEITHSYNFGVGQSRQLANQMLDWLVGVGSSWLSVNTEAGSIAPGATSAVSVNVDATQLIGGTYSAAVLFTPNDPSSAIVEVPLEVRVTGVPSIATDKAQLDFGNCITNQTRELTIGVQNVGTDILKVTAVNLKGDTSLFTATPLTPFDLAPKRQRFITIEMHGTTLGLHRATLELVTNTPNSPTFSIPIRGRLVKDPKASLRPKRIELAALRGATASAPITISNPGRGILDWRIQADDLTSLGITVALDRSTGSTAAGQSSTVQLRARPTTAPAGKYAGQITVITNERDQPPRVVDFEVEVRPSSTLVVSPSSLALPTVWVGATGEATFELSYTGEFPLKIAGIVSSHPSVVVLPTYERKLVGSPPTEITVRIKPTVAGQIKGHLLILYDGHERRRLLPFTGRSIRPPAALFSTSKLEMKSDSGALTEAFITITNKGQAELEWSAKSERTYLSTQPPSGSILGGSQQKVSVMLDAADLGPLEEEVILEFYTNELRNSIRQIATKVSIQQNSAIDVRTSLVDLGECWVGYPTAFSINVASVGTNRFNISLVDGEFIAAGGNLPVTLLPRATLDLPLVLTPSSIVSFRRELTVLSDAKIVRNNKVTISGNALQPPELAVAPSSISLTLDPGQNETRNLTLHNPGGANLNWRAQVKGEATVVPNLETVLTQSTGIGPVLFSFIRSPHVLAQGVTGTFIPDGGADMYVRGNELGTDLGAPVAYSDGYISSNAFLGTSGRSFTRKFTEGLFLFAADLVNASSFKVRGRLGTKGKGRADGAVLTSSVPGLAYKGFVKRVFNADTPGVNHLIIVPDNGAVAHSFSPNTELDDHIITGLSGTTRVYHLAFGSLPGIYVPDSVFQSMLDYLIGSLGSNVNWVTVSPTAGMTTTAGSTVAIQTTFNAASLSPGLRLATLLVRSNAPQKGVMAIPLSLNVNAKPVLSITPASITFSGNTLVSQSRNAVVTLRNSGNVPLTITDVVSDKPDFIPVPLSLPATIQPGATLQSTIRYTPVDAGAHQGNITFYSSDPDRPTLAVPVSGTARIGSRLSVNPSALSLSVQRGAEGTTAFTIFNTGDLPLIWYADLSLSAPAAAINSPAQLTVLRETTATGVNPDRPQSTTANASLIPSAEGVFGSLDGKSIGIIGSSVSSTIIQDLTDRGASVQQLYPPLTSASMAQISAIMIDDAIANLSSTDLSSLRAWVEGGKGLLVQADNASSMNKVNTILQGSGMTASSTDNFRSLTLTNFQLHPITTGITSIYQEASGGGLTLTSALPLVFEQSGAVNAALGKLGNGCVLYVGDEIANDYNFYTGQARQLANQMIDYLALNRNSELSLSDFNGSIAPGGSTSVQVIAKPNELKPSTYLFAIQISGDDPTRPSLQVPFELTVLPRPLEVSPEVIELSTIVDDPLPLTSLSVISNGGSPAWTAETNVPGLRLTPTSGNGSGTINLSAGPFATTGIYSGEVKVMVGNSTVRSRVTIRVLPVIYSQLLTDYKRPVIYGIVRGAGTDVSKLLVLNSTTGTRVASLDLPPDVTDADITTDGDTLYAISFSGRVISAVDLSMLTVTATKPISPGTDSGSGGLYHYDIEAGRAGTVYYTDAQWAPQIHVYNFNTGTDVSTYVHAGSYGTGDFTVSPDGNIIHTTTQLGWSAGSVNSQVVKLNSSADVLSANSGTSSPTLLRDPLKTPVLLSANLDRVFTKVMAVNYDNLSLATQVLPAGSSTYPPSEHIYAASVYGDMLATNINLRRSDGALIQSLGANTTVMAFNGTQDRFFYYDPLAGSLKSVAVSLPSIGVRPGIADGAMNVTTDRLSWTGTPLAASYRVYFSTNGSVVENATTTTAGVYLGEVAATQLSFKSATLQPGSQHYWRVDTVSPAGTVTKGTAWRFHIPLGVVTHSMNVVGFASDTSPSRFSTAISTGQHVSWTAVSNDPWLSIASGQGVGPGQLNLSIVSTNLALGTHVGTVTVTFGQVESHTLTVRATVVPTLELIKLAPDPVLPVVYGLHRTSTAPFTSAILALEPATAGIQSVVQIDDNAADFAVHAHDDRIYVALTAVNQIQILDRNNLSIPPSPSRLLLESQVHRVIAASAGLLVTQGPLNPADWPYPGRATRLRSSTNGSLNSTNSYSFADGVLATNKAGTLLFASTKTNTESALTRHNVSATSLTHTNSAYSYLPGLPTLAISPSENHVYFRGEVRSILNHSLIKNLPEDILACSPSGHVGYSATNAWSQASATVLMPLPVVATLVAASSNGEDVILYNRESSSLHSVPVARLTSTATALDFRNQPINTTSQLNFTVHNNSGRNLTLRLASSNPAFTPLSSTLALNAAQSVTTSVSFRPASLISYTGTLSVVDPQQPSLSLSLALNGSGGQGANSVTFDDTLSLSWTSRSEANMNMTCGAAAQIISTGNSNRPDNGTRHTATAYGAKPMTFTRAGGGSFDAISVDLAEYSTVFPSPKAVTFTGVKADQSTVSITFTTDGYIDGPGGAADFQRFNFSAAFTNLVSLQTNDEVYALDNLQVVLPPSSSSTAVASTTSNADFSEADVMQDHDGDGIGETTLLTPSSGDTPALRRLSASGPNTLLPRLVLQASPDTQSWHSLEADLDYSFTTLEALPDGDVTLEFLIPVDPGVQWTFRLAAP